MIYELRTYTCMVGTVPRLLALYREHGYAVQTRHLGAPVLFGAAEFGALNQYVHLWAYEDLADRARRRAALMADPQWLAYLALSDEAGYLIEQHSAVFNAIPMPGLA